MTLPSRAQVPQLTIAATLPVTSDLLPLAVATLAFSLLLCWSSLAGAEQAGPAEGAVGTAGVEAVAAGHCRQEHVDATLRDCIVVLPTARDIAACDAMLQSALNHPSRSAGRARALASTHQAGRPSWRTELALHSNWLPGEAQPSAATELPASRQLAAIQGADASQLAANWSVETSVESFRNTAAESATDAAFVTMGPEASELLLRSPSEFAETLGQPLLAAP